MLKYVIDSHSWIEYFIDTEKGRKLAKTIESSDNEVFTSVISIAEICSIFKREGRDPLLAYKNIINLSTIHGISPEIARDAGIFHAEIRKRIKNFGMADCIILLTARKLNAKILTGDPHFKGFKEAVMI